MPDTSHRNNADSLRAARAHTQDSIKAAREFAADSLKLARKYIADSVAMVRKYKTDSTASVRKYRESKHYKDSVNKARLSKTEAVKESRESHLDSMQNARKHSADSIANARKSKSDNIKAVQKRRSDSLAAVRKYKTSKRYNDSVSVVKHNRTESIHNAQKARTDSMAGVRKHSMDSAKVARKRSMDSVKTVRTKHLDSVKLVRKAKTDSLTRAKAEKEKIAKAKEKKKEESMKLKLELKMKQKHEAWSNKSMLKKKWSPVRRVAQNSFTHYNYYYNSNRKMEEALVNMQRTRKENYDSVIGLYPYDPNKDSSLMAADMDSIIHKVSVGIQIHDPRVKWEGDMYLMLGEAYYYKGGYENAATSFRYIIAMDMEAKKKKSPGQSQSKSKDGPSIVEDDHKSALAFLKHKSVHNEAILWLARTYTEAHQVDNSESVLSLLEADSKLPEELKGRMAEEKAFEYLTEKNNEEAIKQLAIVADDENTEDWLRMRATFIMGQIQQNMGDHKGAAQSFEKVLAYYPKIDMDFYARKYIAFNELQAGENVAEAMKPLKKVLKDGKYVSYYDQVYFVLGQLAAKANKRDEAITYFTKSVNTPKATKKQKAISYAAMGDVYYSSSRYANAKRAYDSAAKYSTSSKDIAMTAAAQRNKGLTEISGPTTIIHDQDSLLALAALSKKEQQAAVRRYINYLEKKKRDSIQAVENSGVSAAATAAAADADDNKEASGWYFGNPTLVQQGSTDFKRKWGNRPLADNWRRSAAIAISSSSGTTDDNTGDAENGPGALENGLPTEASMLAKIPNTQAQKDLAKKLEIRAYIQLAKAYEKQLEDHNQAIHTLDTLDKRYPDHNQKEEELYLRYQIAVKQNKLDKAQEYSQELLSKFPTSQYASMLRPKHGEGKADEMAGKAAADYFDATYKLLMNHQYTEALMRINSAKEKFDDPVYMKRFQVAEAMAYAGGGYYDQADTVIQKFLHSNPADTLTAWASEVRDYIHDMRTLGKPSWYRETPPGEEVAKTDKKTATPDVKTAVTPPPPPPVPDVPGKYTYQAETEHYCILVLPGLDSRTGPLKSSIRSFDSASYASAGLDLLLDLYDIDQGVLIIKKFANEAEGKAYLTALKASPALQAYKDNELRPLLISSSNYKKMFADKNAASYFAFYGMNYK